ncbi:hypothetical protein ABZ832_16825 [Streptantibioticus parmotrematis]|uniref:hypothetical protein n=1 Tax=Streptantibioticus parmotrematis TaxID=2873249 RepID=UPI0034111AC9
MTTLDITRTNDAIDRLMDVTANPRHRFLLTAYHRHRYLEIGGRYEEIFAPEMTVETPVYHFNYAGISARLEGQEQVKGLYDMWAQTHQSIFYVEEEQIAVADNFIASIATARQQMLGQALIANGVEVDEPDAYYLYTARTQMIWPYDDRGRMIGEDVWETDADQAEIVKLDAADVLTTQEAARLLAPFIKPLPDFDEYVLGASASGAV